jgi:histone H2B
LRFKFHFYIAIVLTKMEAPQKSPRVGKGLGQQKERKIKKKSKQFELYIYRVLKQVHPDTRISGNVSRQLNSLLSIIADEISKLAYTLMLEQQKVTISSREIQSVVRLIIPGEMAKHAVSEGTKAVTKYNVATIDKDEKKNGKKERLEHKAGLTFSVALCTKFLRIYSKRVGIGAAVYLAAVLEYLCAEILELSSNCVRDSKKITISTRHIFLACVNDLEINSLLTKYQILFCGGGVVPNIHQELMPQADAKKIKRKKTDEDGPRQHRFRPGTVALRNIRKYQKTTEQLIPKLPFKRIVRTIVHDIHEDTPRFKEGVILTLQRFVETCVTDVFNSAQEFAIHGKRDGINDKDVELAIKYKCIGMDLTGSVEVEESICQPALKRLAARGGVKRISSKVYEPIRHFINRLLYKVLLDACTYMEHLRSKTINNECLKFAIKNNGFYYVY